MPTIKVQKQTSLNAQESFKRISDLLSNDRDLKKLDSKYQCEFNEKELTGKADGGLFKANMNVKAEGAGSKVEIAVEVGFALALMKGAIEKTLQKKLDEALA